MDLIYIDARKSDYLQYFHRVIDIVAPHTTIIFDDIIKYAHKTSLLYEYLAEKQIQYTLHQLDEDDGIMIIENAGLQLSSIPHI
jgi:predicted O-methyltransferase YrrM